MNSLSTLDLNKRACTGVGLTYGAAPELVPSLDSSGAFYDLVTEYYKFFHEAIADDVAFLAAVKDCSAVAAFKELLYNLRTARQHGDNPNADAYAAAWVDSHANWQESADAFARSLREAIDELAHVSSCVRRDARLSDAWRQRASAAPETIFEAVRSDLAAVFSESQRDYMVRTVARRAQRLRPGADVRRELERFCVEEIVKRTKPLPVAYHAVLDRLNLLGKPHARAALLLAFSISAATTLRGEEFLTRVELAWSVSTQTARSVP
ncbi:hypothetical protein [Cellulosimicrobium sp. NPDC057127]|uniref:hypothetical protein n=1 Tax=Cellulosimicrobium sp. NPDC057127 TaxID=3346026 RepID=UPI003641A81F